MVKLGSCYLDGTGSPSLYSPEANHSNSWINSLRQIEKDSLLTSYTFHVRQDGDFPNREVEAHFLP